MLDFLRRVLFGTRELPPLHPNYSWEQGGTLPTEKEIILFTEPRDADGYIDYETVLNTHLRGDIKPDDNALVLLMQAIGPNPEGYKFPLSFFAWLGTTPPKVVGNYLVPMDQHFKNCDSAELGGRLNRHTRKPWKSTDDIAFADWIKLHDKPLALATEASQRPAYFHPIVTKSGERGLLFSPLDPILAHVRSLATLLCLRANLHAGSGQTAAAWQDVFAAIRLSYLMSQSGTLMELLVGLVTGITCSWTVLGLIENTAPTANELRTYRETFARIPPWGTLESKYALTERVLGLDLLQAIHFYGIQGIHLLEAPNTNITPQDDRDDLFREAVDWRMVMANIQSVTTASRKSTAGGHTRSGKPDGQRWPVSGKLLLPKGEGCRSVAGR